MVIYLSRQATSTKENHFQNVQLAASGANGLPL
jgi:hypothetical protein